MIRGKCEQKIRQLFEKAGVKINGDRPWDLRVLNDSFYTRVCLGGSIGLGESYMDGDWECPRLDVLFDRVLRAQLDEEVHAGSRLLSLRARLFNLQKPSKAYEVGRRHYDMSNELYRLMLDRRMIYSCGYWNHADNIDDAQEAKLDLVCRKLGLQPGMRVLDIGCGWGGAARFAAEHYGVDVVGITISTEQARLARADVQGLPVEIRLQDYRELEGRFDRIFSIGMFEHVGYKNFRTFMQIVRRCLKKDGLFLLHTIGGNQSLTHTDPWIARYIFPNSLVPSAKQIASAAEGCLVLEDWHCFGPDYDKTLMAWFENFEAHWGQLRASFSDRFYRMWTYYLLSCAGAFRARVLQVWQVLLSPTGLAGGYAPARHAEFASTFSADLA